MDNDDRSSGETAFLFDLDGTLVDSVYQHALAWREALEAAARNRLFLKGQNRKAAGNRFRNQPVQLFRFCSFVKQAITHEIHEL